MIHNQIVICKDKEAVGKAAAEHYIALMNTKPGCVLGLATGSTPIPLYKELVALNKTGKIDFSKVHTVNLDEYKGLEPTHDQSFRYFMNSELLCLTLFVLEIQIPGGTTIGVETDYHTQNVGLAFSQNC